MSMDDVGLTNMSFVDLKLHGHSNIVFLHANRSGTEFNN